MAGPNGKRAKKRIYEIMKSYNVLIQYKCAGFNSKSAHFLFYAWHRQNNTGGAYRTDGTEQKGERVLLQHRRVPAGDQEQRQFPQNREDISIHAELFSDHHRRRDVCQHHTGGSAGILSDGILPQ